MSFRLLYLTCEAFPTHNADLTALFGKYLPRLGLFSDIVTEAVDASDTSKSAVDWEGGDTLLCHAPINRALYHAVRFIHNIRSLLSCNPKKYDAIQVRDQPIVALFALIIAHHKKLPFYYWVSYPYPEAHLYNAEIRGWQAGLRYIFPLLRGHLGKFLLYKVVMPRADHNFVQSDKMREDFVQLGVPFEKMTPVPMAVDLDVAKIEDVQPMDDDRLTGKRVLIYMGTLNRTRKIEILFEMLALVRKKQPDVVLVIAGTIDGDHLAWLKQEAERVGVAESIIWTGWIPVAQAWRYARAAEVGLSPFPRSFLLDSASPTKALEYMAFNLPVLCNDNPDQERVIKESGAGLCVPLTGESFANALLQLLENNAQREYMSTVGRQYITQHRSYELLASSVFTVYKNLLDLRSK